MMVPKLIPTRSGSRQLSRVPPAANPASCQASRAASTANWAARFMRRACVLGSTSVGSMGTVPAMRTG